MKKFFKIAGLSLMALLFAYTFFFLYQKSRPKVTLYQLHTPQVRDLEKSTLLTGKVEPRVEVLIKPQISGIVAELYKKAGETVKQNEVIAKVKVIPEMSSLNSAESRVRLAQISANQSRIDFERVSNLYEKKLVSTEEYEKSSIELKRAQEELSNAVDALSIVRDGVSQSDASTSNTLVRSTIDGLLLDVPVKVGNSVILSNTFNEGTTIATVADMNDLVFIGQIDETEVGRIHEGVPVKITLGALQGVTINAQLEYISPKATEQNGAKLFEIKAALEPPRDITVRSGYSANAEIVLDRRDGVLALPESVIEYRGDSTYVNVLTDSLPTQQFEPRAVTTGMSDGLYIEITGGIAQGERVKGLPVEEEKK